MANITEIFAKMKSNELIAHSELGTRDESRQTRTFGTRIQKLKPTVGINARMLVPKDVVIPFNPFTGEVDDFFTEKNKFRAILLVSQVLEGINTACLADEKLKAFWEERLGMKIDSEKPTMEEYYAFKALGYIQPRVFTYDTVYIDFAGRCGFPDFGCKYVVDSSQLNENHSYDFDNSPMHNRLAAFFNSLIKPELEEAVKSLEAAGANATSIAAQKQLIKSKSPISFVNPTNLISFLYLPFNEPVITPKDQDYRGVEKYFRFMNKTFSKLDPVLEEVRDDNVKDELMDYYDLTIRTAGPTAVKNNGSVYTDADVNELYQTLTVTVTDGRASMVNGKITLKDGTAHECKDYYNGLLEQVGAYFVHSQEESGREDGDSFEKIMAASNKFRNISSITDNLLPAANEVFNATFANSPAYTDHLRRAFADVLVAMNPDNALALAAEEVEDIEAAKEASKTSVSQMILEERELQDSGELSIAD